MPYCIKKEYINNYFKIPSKSGVNYIQINPRFTQIIPKLQK